MAKICDTPAVARASSRFPLRAIALVFAPVFVALTGGPGRADEPGFKLDGSWRQSGMREDFTVEQWQASCGPAPVSQTQGGGEVVAIRTENDELVVMGGGRVWRTDQCYDPMPTLARVAHSRDPNQHAWTTRCATPANDARRGRATTQVNATERRIDIVETAHYELSVADGMCIANVKRTRSFTSMAAPAAPTASVPASATVAPAPPPPEPTAKEPPPGFCTSPGPAARLEVKPSRKLLRAGEAFTFEARILDAKGCALSSEAPPVWAVTDPARGVTVDSRGKVTTTGGSSEGPTDLTATALGQRVKVTVEVASADAYDKLLAKSGGVTETLDDTSSVALVAQGSDTVRAEDTSKKRRTIFGAIVFGLAALLGVAWFIAARRGKRARVLEQEAKERYEVQVRDTETKNEERRQAYESQLQAHEKSKQAREAALAAKAARAALRTQQAPAADVPQLCPVCLKEYQRPLAFCPHDGTALVDRTSLRAASPQPVCPVCRKGFGLGAKVCPDHGEELVPLAGLDVGARGALFAKRGPIHKICPTCGDKFEGQATFCGKDGTVLVPMN